MSGCQFAVAGTSKWPLLCCIMHCLLLGQQSMILGAPKAGIQGMSGCSMLQSWDIHNTCQQKAALADSRHASSQNISRLCILRINIGSVSRLPCLGIREMRESSQGGRVLPYREVGLGRGTMQLQGRHITCPGCNALLAEHAQEVFPFLLKHSTF